MTEKPENDVREEYFDSQATGVEVEETDPEQDDDVQPWDPERIRVHTKHFSLRQVVDMIQDEDIDIAPDFQRLYVWKEQQRWSLIESILLGIPLPTFYFNENEDGTMQVVDGVQRLTTIFNFLRGEKFTLGEMGYLNELSGKTFEGLSQAFRRRMHNTQFVVHVIDPQTPFRVKFDIFRRINTGGSPLSPQEIRHCMSRRRSRSLLHKLATSESFNRATGGSLRNHIRMADREVALRFCAFRVFDLDTYDRSKSLDTFLIEATERLDDESKFTDKDLKELVFAFHRAMDNAHAVFGEHAFRKWPLSSERRNPVNRALFEAWSVVLADYEREKVVAKADQIAKAARRLMTDDEDFLAAISQGTGDSRRVRRRFEAVRGIVQKELG
ncbi:DUF262 domain-containing protein [Pseudenhygromyxa sp. WMMC2535]|uniref:DUF262 domain-containing protein n=1 Tax=Pseudenhygromyxa sp. WMMC2535 TaxID=2712867 RepID=UPI001552C042|nr:DUF262 domain-containing protein [Pseudenhygromyxa sp. WMMC2535]NVB37140.1 DUF262 domain-containing protein [Pseudenhygromyxa sp. WMMC2535]